MTDQEATLIAALREALEADRDRPPALLDAHGSPVRRPPTSCPRCGAGPEKRRLGGGFGPVRLELCGVCGHVLNEVPV